jgi:hypothetical protein
VSQAATTDGQHRRHHLAPIAAIAVADWRERVRRPSYLVALAAVSWLGWGVMDGSVSLRLGDYRGVYNAAWVGGMMALVIGTFLSLAGFYLVKGTIRRDAETGVGQILAATSLSRLAYIVGKWLSNLMVLASFAVLLGAAAVVMILWRGEAGASLFAVLHDIGLPLLLLSLPALSLIAALAVLFEVVPGLAGGVGNVVYFFLWGFGFTLGMMALDHDPLGAKAITPSMRAALFAQHGVDETGFSLTIEPSRDLHTFAWQGVEWTAGVVGWRLVWFLASLGLLAVAALTFDRFAERRSLTPQGQPQTRRPVRRGLPGPLRQLRLPGLVGAELHLLLAERSWVWFVGVGGLWIAGLVNGPAAVADMVLPLALIWPLFAWSSLGGREEAAGTTGLVWTAPRPIVRQLIASWAAGVLMGWLVAAPGLAHLAAAGVWSSFGQALLASLFIPSLALACGAFSRGTKLFEALYLVLWYIGPMQGPSPLDFIGGIGAASSLPATLSLFTAALLVGAAAVRRWRLEHSA